MSDFISLAGYEVTASMIPSLLLDLGLLPVFIKRLLIRKNTSHIIPTKEQQIEFQKSFFNSHSLLTEDDLSSWLSANDLSESEMTLHLYRSLQQEILKNDMFSNKIESYFLEHKSDLDLYAYSLIQSNSRLKINEIYVQLIEEEDTFASLSHQFSEGPESLSNGYISPKSLNKVHPEIAERLRISKPGQLWPPFLVNQSWLLIRMEKLIPSSLDSKTSSSILSLLFDSWLDDQLVEELDRFRTSSDSLPVDIIDYKQLLDSNFIASN